MMYSEQKGESSRSSGTMVCARLHEYQKPLLVEDIPRPASPIGEQVIVRVGAAGLCHSDLHLISGEWKDAIPITLPKTPGHEVAGWVEEMGESVPPNTFSKGELVAVFGGWGCGICQFCKRGDEQMCIIGQWPGLSTYDGGYSQYILVPSYRFLVKGNPDRKGRLTVEELAPLTDAGLTPYRAVKKVRHMLGPGTSIAVIGIGGLGSYGVQYAKLLAPNALVIGIDRSESKLTLAENFGADYTVNMSASKNIREDVLQLTGGRGVDVVLDAVGAESTADAAFRILAKGGALVLVGLFGSTIKMPLVASVINENQVIPSLWGNYNELREVIELASQRKIKHAYKTYPIGKINEAIDLLRNGQITGRAVIVP